MRKFVMLLVAVLVLCGCDDQKDVETVMDDYVIVTEPAAAVSAMWPEEMSGFTAGEDRIWFCDGYTITVQTMAAGDLDGSLREVTGFGAEQLTLWKTEDNGIIRYECAWSCAGEGGDQVARLVLLDDGAYHYAVSVMADATMAGQLGELWSQVLETVSLGDTDSGFPGKGPGIV